MKARMLGSIAVIVALATAAVVWRGRPPKADGQTTPSQTTLSTPEDPHLGEALSRPTPQPWLATLQALASASASGAPSGDGAEELAVILERHMGMSERFEKEARDPAWAPAREKEVKESVERDFTALKQDAWVSSIRCRTRMCLLEIASPSAAGLENAKVVLGYAPRASAIQFRGDWPPVGNGHVAGFVLEFDGTSRDADTFADWQATERQSALEDLARLRVGRSIPEELPSPPPL